MDDIKYLFKDNYIKYASYVILDRAIPNVVDGLKPVQRRILHTLFRIHDGKLHKVANVAGQTMAFHPHGDAPIIDALVNMSNKGFFLDQQGNFGNIYTGDPAAAARYIETRLSPLAKETLFNPDLTAVVPSYDGRNQEPVTLPAKVPVVLMQGTSGIAVGMSTNVLPHNFVELLEAEIAIIEGKEFEILPDFITGGIMDSSEYEKGRGKIKLRAKIDVRDPKTIVITEICHGTTTESLIRSIDEAAKRGKIKIDSINDYTSDKVEIEIKLPRGHYAEDLIDTLYAYTECEVSINCMCMVIKDDMPWETTVDEILVLHTQLLKGYLKAELELERERLLEKIFDKTLEQIFIENRLYKELEKVKSSDKLRSTVSKSLEPYHSELARIPTKDDIEKLLQIPIRRISRFDLDKNQEEIAGLRKELRRIEKDLKNIKQFTINYLNELIAKYGKAFPRRTKMSEIRELDKRAIATKEIAIGIDLKTGFVGTKVSGTETIEGTNFDKLLIMYQDGTYRVTNIPEKEYVHLKDSKAVFVGLADKKTVFSVAYRDVKTHICFAKRFIIKQFILDKGYRYFEEGMDLAFLATEPEPKLEIQFIPKIKQKISKIDLKFSDVLVKGVSAKGVKVSSRGVKKVKAMK
jgi:topoisomerase IV subunit A